MIGINHFCDHFSIVVKEANVGLIDLSSLMSIRSVMMMMMAGEAVDGNKVGIEKELFRDRKKKWWEGEGKEKLRGRKMSW